METGVATLADGSELGGGLDGLAEAHIVGRQTVAVVFGQRQHFCPPGVDS